MSKTLYKTVAFEPGEFEREFPEIAERDDLNESDKVRLALGLQPRKATAGAHAACLYAETRYSGQE